MYPIAPWYLSVCFVFFLKFSNRPQSDQLEKLPGTELQESCSGRIRGQNRDAMTAYVQCVFIKSGLQICALLADRAFLRHTSPAVASRRQGLLLPETMQFQVGAKLLIQRGGALRSTIFTDGVRHACF